MFISRFRLYKSDHSDMKWVRFSVILGLLSLIYPETEVDEEPNNGGTSDTIDNPLDRAAAFAHCERRN